jgi:hypothetical protein
MPQGLKKKASANRNTNKPNNRRGPIAKRRVITKAKNKSASSQLNDKLSKNINASIEAQMIALSEREKKGQLRVIDASVELKKRKHGKGEPKKSERKQLKALVKEASRRND